MLRALRKDGVVRDYELTLKKKDGSPLFVSVTSTFRKDDHGNILGVEGVIRDITERKQGEESLRLSEDRYRRLFEDAVLGIFRSTPEGNFINVNQAYARMHGFDSPEETKSLVKNVANDLYADPSRRNEIVRMIFDARGPIHTENLYKRKDGSIFTGNLHAWAVRDREGKPLYIEGFVEDITERKRSEEERMRLVTAIEQTAEAVIITDTNWIIGYVNPAFSALTGYDGTEAVGRHLRLLKSDKHDRAFYRGIGFQPLIPVIIMTGFSNNMDAEKAKDLGIQGFLMKPITLEQLAKTVREVLDPRVK